MPSSKPEFTVDWFTHNIPVLDSALRHLKDTPVLAIELGCYEGQSSIWLVENVLTHKSSRLYCIDTWSGSEEHNNTDMTAVYERFKDNVANIDKIIPYKRSSTRVLIDWLNHSDGYVPANLIYIDASHKAKDVITDAVLSHLILKPGGILIFDDYLWGGLEKAQNVPKPAIDAFMECYATEYDVLYIGYQVILKKKDKNGE